MSDKKWLVRLFRAGIHERDVLLSALGRSLVAPRGWSPSGMEWDDHYEYVGLDESSVSGAIRAEYARTVPR